MKLIGLSGKAGCGKNTVADMIRELVEARGLAYFEVPFAGAIKEQARALGWDGRKDVNGRVLLQYIGERERQDDEYYWIDLAMYIIGAGRKDGIYVIPDTRFLNEAQAIQRAGGEVWRIERNGAGLIGAAAQHSSEMELDSFPNWDAKIHNSGTLDDLRKLVEGCVRELFAESGQPLGQAYHQGKL